jgi:2-hydroxychromene-2-carboxylate isomerase
MAVIEYFYSAHSAYAYLGAAELMRIAERTGRTIEHRPMDVNLVMESTGLASFREMPPVRKQYFFNREIARWSEIRGAPVGGRPTHHDNPLDLSNGMLIAALMRGHNIDRLHHDVLEAHWRYDADLADRETLAKIAESAGFDPDPLLDAALSPDVVAQYKANNDEAVVRWVMGSPTYFVDGDMFYGQDRLDQVERACATPFAGPLFDGGLKT